MKNSDSKRASQCLFAAITISLMLSGGEDLSASDTEYTIGDNGPAGGYIFYIDEADEYDWTYLEAAPADVLVENENPQWGAMDLTVAVPGPDYTDEREGLGSGQDNTSEIVSFFDSLEHTETGETYYDFDWNNEPEHGWVLFTDNESTYRIHTSSNGTVAATLAHEYEQNGFSDWFLPSKETLNEIYENLDMNGVGGFESSFYWSSSERSFRLAWHQAFSASSESFTDGMQRGTFKNSTGGVRPVRAF